MKFLKDSTILKKIWDRFGFNIFIFIGLAGIALIAAGELIPQKNEPEPAVYDTEDYRQIMEDDLTRLLSSVQGAGKVQVMVTLESGRETVYAWQEKTTDDTRSDNGQEKSQRSTYENEVVMVSAGSDRQALVEKTLQPAVQGVVVVCEGAGDIRVVSDITNAVSIALNVPTSRVCVIKMQ